MKSLTVMVVLSVMLIFFFSYASAQQKQTESRDAKFYFNRGVANFEKGQLDQAILDFNKALEINPRYAPSYYERGYVYYLRKEYDKCWKDINKAQELGYQIPPEFLDDLRKASGREK